MLRLIKGSNASRCGVSFVRSRDGLRQARLQNLHRPALQQLERRWASFYVSGHEDQKPQESSSSASATDGKDGKDKEPPRLPILEYLRKWDRENAQLRPQPAPHDSSIYGAVANDLTRTQSTGSSEMDDLHSTRGGMTDDPEAEEAEGADGKSEDVPILGAGSRVAGDLVELRATGSRVPLFAIYLGFFGQRNHFYASNGRWIISRGFSSLFTVPHFATEAELAPLMARIPQRASPEEFDVLRREDKGPLRADAAPLIERMHRFRIKAESTYQNNLESLDTVKKRLARREGARHLTLSQIADKLLPAHLKNGDGEFSTYALYAVHTALTRSEIGFRPLNSSRDCRGPDNLIEIFSLDDMKVVDKVATMLRDYSDRSIAKGEPPSRYEIEKMQLGKFLIRARAAVKENRKKRQYTPHGILEPTSGGVILEDNAWTKVPAYKEIIDFLEWWASHDVFEPGSRFHNYGSLLLRALRLYPDSQLDQSTAWTFLQEIGVITPWEMPSRYKVRFPGVTVEKGGGLKRPTPKDEDLDKSKRPDIAAGVRKDHGKATVFCIDAPSTIIIDDGVSLERTEKRDEFWVHVHAADPASSIEPKSGLYEYMALIPENIYLPGHFQAMLPSELGGEEDDANAKDFESQSLIKQFSLKSGSPALTFSAKVNEAGDILDYKVEPSKLGSSVVYVDPQDVARFCDEPAPPPVVASRRLEVGSPPKDQTVTPNRAMIPAEDLDPSSKEDLRTMYRLAEAIRAKRLSKGAWPYFFPGPSVSVSFHDPQPKPAPAKHMKGGMSIPEDPYIKVSYEASSGCSIVSNFMVLAGQVAARWCSSRGIPIPFRRDIRHDQPQYADHALDLAKQEIYPLIARGVEPSFDQRQELSRLTGGIEIASSPGPYFLLGLDMYAKATSPLRRFSDLLVHWQIHAALQHERLTGHRLNLQSEAEADNILPFYGRELDDTLALLQMREKMARTMSRGVMDWILMALVRAWRFEHSSPTSLRFTVGALFRQGLLGRIDLFGLSAVMDVEGLDGKALVRDVRVGDRFEVELADVNVHSRQILVKAVKYLGGHGKRAG